MRPVKRARRGAVNTYRKTGFRHGIPRVEVLQSALRHRVGHEDIRHVPRAAVLNRSMKTGSLPGAGFDQAGNLLELVVSDQPWGQP